MQESAAGIARRWACFRTCCKAGRPILQIGIARRRRAYARRLRRPFGRSNAKKRRRHGVFLYLSGERADATDASSPAPSGVLPKHPPKQKLPAAPAAGNPSRYRPLFCWSTSADKLDKEVSASYIKEAIKIKHNFVLFYEFTLLPSNKSIHHHN